MWAAGAILAGGGFSCKAKKVVIVLFQLDLQETNMYLLNVKYVYMENLLCKLYYIAFRIRYRGDVPRLV